MLEFVIELCCWRCVVVVVVVCGSVIDVVGVADAMGVVGVGAIVVGTVEQHTPLTQPSPSITTTPATHHAINDKQRH